ncbi:helix-turn-helix transcriptional regulator [Streptomyces thermolineatus]|uniref:Helix-turn-helix transcriptional regulator n=1 Tax=Streptomyces thermolineatus TaxID=44033 RepID=A0ABN3ML49_9ACTN
MRKAGETDGRGVQDGEDGSASEVLRYFGRQLALFRTKAGLTQTELGRMTGYSESSVAAFEHARRIPQPDFVDRVDDLLRAEGILRAGKEFLELARYPPHFRNFARLEADAVSLYSYENQTFPGLLQTEEYARALFRVRVPPLGDEAIERFVAARIERREVLTREPLVLLNFVIEESVLRRPLGGTAVLKGQLERLVECAELRNVKIQVMPTRREEHAGMAGPLVLVETGEHRSLAYVEGQGQSTLISKPESVSVLSRRYGILRSQALTPWESVALVKRLVGEL